MKQSHLAQVQTLSTQGLLKNGQETSSKIFKKFSVNKFDKTSNL